MNKKGQMDLTWIVLTAVGLIVGLILLQAAFASTSPLTTLTSTTEAGRINQTSYSLVNCRDATLISVKNTTSGLVIGAGNYTYTASTCGFVNASVQTWNAVSFEYTYEGTNYLQDSGARALVGLIIIISAVAIAVYSIPNLRDYISDFF